MTLRRGVYRVWLTRRALVQFDSSHHHHVAGQPPIWRRTNVSHLRYFRVCYRVFVPRAGRVRVKLDQMHIAVPENPADPNSELMLATTFNDENALFAALTPDVLSGNGDEPLPVDDNGVFIEELPIEASADMLLGSAGVFEADLPPETEDDAMDDVVLLGNEDLPTELNNNQLSLFCIPLRPNGTPAVDRFDGGDGQPPLELVKGFTPALPTFEEEPLPPDDADPAIGGGGGLPVVMDPTKFCLTIRRFRPFQFNLWSFNSRGIWRREVRARELARWYRHYNWTTDTRLWLKRRAEGVWITGRALRTFTCRSHCILRNPRGRGLWKIWRTFRRADVRRFRKHYRIYWPGHVNPAIADAAGAPNADDPINRRFAATVDHVEVVLPMEPEDPDPATPFNEAVMIMDENGEQHFLGEEGFEVMPDTERNPDGFQLATTALSTRALPEARRRIVDDDDEPMPGMVEVQPGVIVHLLTDDHGNVLVDADGDGERDPLLSPDVLGNQKHPGTLPLATGEAGNLLELDMGATPLTLNCAMLDENGEIVGAAPGQVVVGPPVGPDDPIGALSPMDPTVRDEDGVLFPDEQPVTFAFEEEGPPDADELREFNEGIAEQLPGFRPMKPPFNLCIRRFHNRSLWGVDRRVVYDQWIHHLEWRTQQHITLRTGLYRVWLSRLSLSQFRSLHRHLVVGQPEIRHIFQLQHVRFFRVCYRVFCPRPGVVRVKIDGVWAVVPMNPDNPVEGLMLLTTETNENALMPAAVLAGVEPDPLPFGDDGVLVEELDPVVDGFDMGAGGAGVFDADVTPVIAAGGDAVEVALNPNNTDFADLLCNNQLQLNCFMLDEEGNVAADDAPSPGIFRRGDADGDGDVDEDDAEFLAAFIFQGGPPPVCGDAADANDDGIVEIADVRCHNGVHPRRCGGDSRAWSVYVRSRPHRRRS